MSELGRLLIVGGIVLVVLGAVVTLFGGPLRLGRLPGDLQFGSGNTRVYIPLATMLLLSLALTLVANLMFRLFGR